LGSIDKGMDSVLDRTKRLFPDAHRAVLYSPGEAGFKSNSQPRADLKRVAREYASAISSWLVWRPPCHIRGSGTFVSIAG
jgi:hypothetical protein